MARGKYAEWLKPEKLAQLEMWARQGLTCEDIAKNIGVARTTLELWKSTYPDISNAIKKGNVCADRVVENALYKRACGYDVVESEMRRQKDPETGEYAMVEVARKIRHVPPDTTAQIYWLKNRMPGEWRDKPQDQAAHDNDVHVTFDIDEEDE